MLKRHAIDLKIVGVRENRKKPGTASYLLAEFTVMNKCRPMTSQIAIGSGYMTVRQQEAIIALQKMHRFIPYYAEVLYEEDHKYVIGKPIFKRWRTAQDVARCAA